MAYIQKISYEIPNAKDKNQWYAGGYLRNESYPGGLNFSSTAIPSYNNDQQLFSISRSLLSGNFLFLNGGFALVDSLVKGGMFDLMQRINESVIFRFEYFTEITDVDSGNSSTTNGFFNIYYNEDNDMNSISVETDTTPASLADTKAAYDARFSVMDMNPLSVSFAVLDVTTQKEVNLSQTLSSAVMGTAFSTAKSSLSQAVVSALGITNSAIALGLSLGLGFAFDEAMEVAMGLDNSFGFGGDIQGVDSRGEGMFSKSISFSQGINDIMSEISSFGKADTNTFNPSFTGYGLTDAYGNDIGFSSISGNFTGQNEVAGFSDAYGNEISSISDAISSNSYGELSSDDGFGADQAGSNSGLGHSNESNGLGAGLEGIDVGGLSSVGDVNNGADLGGAGGDAGGGDGSFIATAMDHSLGTNTVKIYEEFRDNYVLHQDGGKALMLKYYVLSPRIVKEINLLKNSKEVYQWIYDEYLSIGIELIKDKKFELAFDGYSQLVRTLYAMFVKKDKSYFNKKLNDIVLQTKTKKQIY